MRRTVGLAMVTLLVAACGGSDDEASSPTTEAPSTTTEAAPGESTAPAAGGTDLEAVSLSLSEVGRFDQPLAMTWCGDTALVAEKGGRVRTLAGDDVLDLTSRVSSGSEQGLLGIACSADGTNLYVSYTDRSGTSLVEEVPRSDSGVADRGRPLLEQRQPASNHNGGNILFGPDGKLWLGLGDGGGGNDGFDNAQEPGERLGSILRLDPAGAEPEIVLKGVRNPWRFSFDRETGDLWIGDVGQGAREEIDRLPPDEIDGANLGWPAWEGSRRNRSDVAEPPDAVDPVFEYGRDEGQSIVGGYVYRGGAIPGLEGAYLFADTYHARLRAIAVEGDEVVAERDFGEVPGGLVSSFAEGPDGELYVLSLDGGIYRLDAR